MSLINSVAPAGVSSGPQVNVQAVQVAQATGAANAGPAGKLLLQSAVTAPVLVPNYNEAKQPATNKPALKLTTSQPSSSLAAQLFAQSPEVSAEEFALFVRRDPPQAEQQPQQNPIANNNLPNEQRTAPQAPAPSPIQALQQAVQNITSNNIAATLNTKPTISFAPVKETTPAPERPAQTQTAGTVKRSVAKASYQFVVEAARHHFTERAVEAVG